MIKIEKEIFEFFTQENNFISMFKVVQQFEPIKKQLLIEFWDLVIKNLETINKTNQYNWIIKKTGNIEDKHTIIMLYRHSWPMETKNFPLIAVAYDRLAQKDYPYYGIWLNNDAENKDLDKIRNYIINLQISKKYDEEPEDWWPIWIGSEVDFSNDDDFIKILPNNREELAQNFAKDLIDFAEIFSSDLEEIIKM